MAHTAIAYAKANFRRRIMAVTDLVRIALFGGFAAHELAVRIDDEGFVYLQVTRGVAKRALR